MMNVNDYFRDVMSNAIMRFECGSPGFTVPFGHCRFRTPQGAGN